MFDSLPIVMMRHDDAPAYPVTADSTGVMGIGLATKASAIMMALAGTADLPGIVVPGGVTLPVAGAKMPGCANDWVRFTHDLISLEYAAKWDAGLWLVWGWLPVSRHGGYRPGGCRALGMALPHSALAPSGEPIWLTWPIARPWRSCN